MQLILNIEPLTGEYHAIFSVQPFSNAHMGNIDVAFSLSCLALQITFSNLVP